MQHSGAPRDDSAAAAASASRGTLRPDSPAGSKMNAPVPPQSSSKCPSPRAPIEHTLPWQWPAEEVARSPSVEDGKTHIEVLERKHYAFKFIEEMRAGMKFQPIITVTAMALYNRFYHYQSMTQFHWKQIASCCLFAAFKIEEKVIKMDSLLKWAHRTHCILQNKAPEPLDVHGQHFFEMKERLQFNERMLLQTIGFEVSMTHPPFLIIKLIKALRQKSPIYSQSWLKNTAKVAVDWSICSSGSELCLVYRPEVLAVAFVYGAAHDVIGTLEHPSETKKMWDLWDDLKGFAVTEHLLHRIMVKFHTYSVHFKEPRAYWRQQNAAARAKQKGTEIPKIDATRPPRDPAYYHPDAPQPVKSVLSKPVAAPSTPAASSGHASAPTTASVSPPTSSQTTAAPSRSVDKISSRSVSAPAATGISSQPTPPRTADNSPRAIVSPVAAAVPTPDAATAASASVAPSSEKKRPLVADIHSGGEATSCGGDVKEGWHEPSAAKRARGDD